ncbi:MAG: RodZ domain-containing protein [Pseudomonadota bacterium]
MSEATPASVGQALRAAREAQGLTVEETASRLRLMHRQIEAMETEDFASLGQPVFARGFVRNYARLLNIAPEPLLARMAGAPTDAVPVSHDAPRPPTHWLTSPWLLLLLFGVLLAAVVPVALYWWLNTDAEEEAQPILATVPTTAAVPHPSAINAAAEAEAVSPSATGAVAQTTPEQAVGSGELHLDFGGESWVEIRDASGRMLLRQLNPPGSSIDVAGRPPFEIVIGNAAQARLSYNGRPIDLAPFIDVTVARFTLEE